MKIKTIDDKLVDTDKLSDGHAEMIEVVENSGILKWAGRTNSFCFVVVGNISQKKNWSTTLIKNSKELNQVIFAIKQLVERVTEDKMTLVLTEKE